MGIYDQAPQMYGQMLQNGLDKQFQLATTAQPVSQFLAGLKQAQAMKLAQEEMDRRNADSEWQQQKFAEQDAWNRERTGIEDTRFRDKMAADLQTKAERENEIKRQNAAQEKQNFYNRFSKFSTGSEEESPLWSAQAKLAGVDPVAEGLASEKTFRDVMRGPYADESEAVPNRKVTLFKQGPEFVVSDQVRADRNQLAQDKLQQDADLKREGFQNRAAIAQMGHSVGKGLQSLSNGLQMGKIPPGYRMTADGNMEAIPGGPGANKESATQSKASAALEGVTNEMDRLYQSAGDAKNHPGLEKTLGWTRLGRIYPGQEAADARALIGSLKAKGGFAVLQAMRNSSPTGGALGQVSDKEEQLLQNAIASLDDTQGLEQMQKSLEAFQKYTQDAKARMKNAYELQFGGGQSTDVHPEARPKGGNPFSAIGKGGKPMAIGTTRTSKRTGITETWNGQAWE